MDGAIALCQWLSNKIEYNIRAASQILQPDNTNAISSQKKKKTAHRSVSTSQWSNFKSPSNTFDKEPESLSC